MDLQEQYSVSLKHMAKLLEESKDELRKAEHEMAGLKGSVHILRLMLQHAMDALKYIPPK